MFWKGVQKCLDLKHIFPKENSTNLKLDVRNIAFVEVTKQQLSQSDLHSVVIQKGKVHCVEI